jgi:beta-galactosidase/beta-glucuronidase
MEFYWNVTESLYQRELNSTDSEVQNGLYILTFHGCLTRFYLFVTWLQRDITGK